MFLVKSETKQSLWWLLSRQSARKRQKTRCRRAAGTWSQLSICCSVSTDSEWFASSCMQLDVRTTLSPLNKCFRLNNQGPFSTLTLWSAYPTVPVDSVVSNCLDSSLCPADVSSSRFVYSVGDQ